MVQEKRARDPDEFLLAQLLQTNLILLPLSTQQQMCLAIIQAPLEP